MPQKNPESSCRSSQLEPSATPIMTHSPAFMDEILPPMLVTAPPTSFARPPTPDPQVVHALRMGSQIQRPRSSPISPCDDITTRFGPHIHNPRRDRHRSYSVGSSSLPPLAVTERPRPSSSHSSPGKRSAVLPHTMRGMYWKLRLSSLVA